LTPTTEPVELATAEPKLLVIAKPRLIVWTLNIGNYQPAIRALTMPMMNFWARKIGAACVNPEDPPAKRRYVHEITERKFPGWPVVYEKLQLHELGKLSEWTIFLDADTLVSPDMFDPSNFMGKDTVAHNGSDMANVRWKYDEYFRRDGRNFGSCNWCTIASEWCLDLWHPLDISFEQALTQIHTTIGERNSGHCEISHLIDDFTLSRNIARYGLKATTLVEIGHKLGFRDQAGRGVSPYLYHIYSVPERVKLEKMLELLTRPQDNGGWGMMSLQQNVEFRAKWGLK
jgi:hypothetical protein